jgi:sn-glycerol 3-phosphate transport system substrate-binding protein
MMAAGDAVLPVWRLVSETGTKLDPDVFVPAVRGYYSLPDGRLASMPFNSSTCICWYNQDAFVKAGLELVAAAQRIGEATGARFAMTTASLIRAHFEQFSAIHDLPYATDANGFNGPGAELRINSPAHVRHLDRLLQMARAGKFQYIGRDGAGDGPFVAGESAIHFGSSALRGTRASAAKFRWAPAFMPYDPGIIREPINSAIGGASLCVLTARGRSAAEYRATAAFLAFLAEPENDAAWAEATGYVPVTHAGFERTRQDGWLDRNPGADLPIRQLTRGRVSDNSRGFLGRMPEIRTIIEEEYERAVTGLQNAQSALDSAVVRGNRVLRALERTL